MQRVVFNANYLVYCEEASGEWFREVANADGSSGWEVMVKKAQIVWHSGARARDELVITVDVRRWGVTSFDVGFMGTIGEAAVFEAVLTYVAVVRGTHEPMAVPAGFRSAAQRMQVEAPIVGH